MPALLAPITVISEFRRVPMGCRQDADRTPMGALIPSILFVATHWSTGQHTRDISCNLCPLQGQQGTSGDSKGQKRTARGNTVVIKDIKGEHCGHLVSSKGEHCGHYPNLFEICAVRACGIEEVMLAETIGLTYGGWGI